ncbi:potassium channel family protein [Streptomyces sp. NBC_00083]|uniref:potassium channel family protein n=1 Tax=Streptomyces sp. NBC_00083 TaxID=2975647 RepID=UPI0022532153|nr:potassium channel family protein [Streptomyces sp. NBC_00083]MCX5384648.1 potassium channel family protein [Streptomyces sp. NBC_00083]
MDRAGSGVSRLSRTVHVLRALASAVLVTALYYVAPLDWGVGVGTVAVLVGALVVFGWLLARQLASITRARFPWLRAVQALAVAVPLFLVMFSAAYFLLAHDYPESFSEPLSRTAALYFTISVFVTVGFGDIVPTSEVARALTSAQMIVDLIVLAVLGKAVFGAVRVGLRRRGRPEPGYGLDPGASVEGGPDDQGSS